MSKAAQRRRSAQQARAKSAGKITVDVLAIKHYPDSDPEMVLFQAQVSKLVINDKNDLLHYICRREWLHQPPADEIAQYLIQTQSYKMFSGFNGHSGYLVNFFAQDPDRPNTYSCRDIIAMPVDQLRTVAQGLVQEWKKNKSYSVREFA